MLKLSLRCAAFIACLSLVPALAQTPKQAAAPTQAQIDLARKVVIDSGLSRSFATIVLQTMGQINSTVTATRPELINDMRTTLNDLQPEFMKATDPIINGSANIFAALMTEQELKDQDAFFTSTAGKKYVDAQPALLANVTPMMTNWSHDISTSFMSRVRDEMKKKGHDI